MKNRYGYRTGQFRDWPIERTARGLRDMGYGCIEICLERDDVRPELLTERRCREIRSYLDDLGVAIASLSYHADSEDAVTRKQNQIRAVRAAGWMSAGILVLNPERSHSQDTQWAEHVARFRDLCALADQVGVTIALEPEPLMVVPGTAEMIEMMRAVGSPRLKVNLDIGHAQITDADLVESIRLLGSAIVHVHLEDIKDKVHRHLQFGEGDIDFAGVRAALDETGYVGPLVIDLFGPGMEPADAARIALAGLRERF